MESKKQDAASQSSGKAGNAENKNKSAEEKSNDKGTTPEKEDMKAGQQRFINETEETENLIDPGNEHHHHADEADKKLGKA